MTGIQDKMQGMLHEIVAKERDTGIQLAVYHKGGLAVNAWAGIADTDTNEPVTEHTLFPVFSVTKGITATMLHILAERGALDYEQRICELWPEFAKYGKENIRIRHTLDHTAGIPQMPDNITAAEANDWDGMCRKIEDLKPLWAPGERLEYHALTYGWIIGRIIELVSKQSFADFMKREICEPLGTKSMFIGIPGEALEAASIATLYEPGFDRNNLNTSGIITIPDFGTSMCGWINQRSTLQACIPAANGLFNALSLARHFAALLPGGADGVTLLSEDTVKKAAKVSSSDLKPDGLCEFGLGYSIGGYDSRKSIFGHGGYGGSIAFADSESNLAVALTKNYFHINSAEMEIVRAVQEMLG